ncbi:MAG: hypothetical protein KAJ24_02230, partial [Candidatus Aenigmarchaeota archaeon]|nr:hypothetical protein [Candidatus Aenigmarchaeota archaeon]
VVIARKTKFFITNDTAENYIGYPPGFIWTDDEGITTYTLEPGCEFSVGPQKWKAGILDNTDYNSTNSSVFYFNVTASPLEVVLEYPNGQTFVKGVDNILLRGNVTDECGLVAGATASIKVIRGVTQYAECNPSNDEGTGWYNCTIANTTHAEGGQNWPTGLYNVTIQADKAYYEGSETFVVENAFRLVTVPILSGPSASSDEGGNLGGWGETWDFGVNVEDADGNDVTIYFWVNLTGTWELLNTTTWNNPGYQEFVPFIDKTFTCSATPDLGTKQYMFNASDEYGYKANISSTFTLEKDDTDAIPTSTLGESVDRNGTDTILLRVRLRDTDASQYVGSGVYGKIWVTQNYSDTSSYDEGYILQTDASGYLDYNFDINCSYTTGTHTWMGGTFNDECYADPIYNEDDFDSKGKLSTNIELPVNGTGYNTGTPIPFRFNVTSDCQNEGTLNVTSTGIELQNPSLSWKACSPITSEGGANTGWYNCTWDSTFNEPGWWNVRTNATNNTYYTAQDMWDERFELINSPPIYNSANVTPNISGWGYHYNYTVNVTDSDMDDINCTLYTSANSGSSWVERGTVVVPLGQGICAINVSDFGCGDMGDDNLFLFELDDNYNPAENTSSVSGPNMTADTVTIEYIFGNGSTVNRQGTDTTLLIVQVNDTHKQGAPIALGADATFWITDNGATYDSGTLNTTNSSGYVNYYFDPDCSPLYEPGVQQWTAGVTDSCYTDINLTINYTLTNYASLVNSITNPPLESEYERGTNVTVDATVKDDCNVGLVGVGSEMFFTHEIDYVNYSCTVTDEGSGFYRCKRNTTDMKA